MHAIGWSFPARPRRLVNALVNIQHGFACSCAGCRACAGQLNCSNI